MFLLSTQVRTSLLTQASISVSNRDRYVFQGLEEAHTKIAFASSVPSLCADTECDRGCWPTQDDTVRCEFTCSTFKISDTKHKYILHLTQLPRLLGLPTHRSAWTKCHGTDKLAATLVGYTSKKVGTQVSS
ncbi:hypothetical protein CPSG_01919 [Coccidioides posadasii str. Silveira]|uniref:Uncharacterized protein n=1 Tax=Coccidioides posadasii (strain RMSCC 757 / Silveira) TaxID=443226 RepID=E9CWT6_COCPS|nr:hypothetical protein CPSG_01919 [Coccidioides posadasii str. Silveira]